VYLVSLDRVVGGEIRKTRPCAVISPDEMNRHIRTVIVAPMTTQGHAYPTRVGCRFKGKTGRIVLDQLRTVDTQRLVKRLGVLEQGAQAEVLRVLAEMFAP
jgi:mRNA interferase MazF